MQVLWQTVARFLSFLLWLFLGGYMDLRRTVDLAPWPGTSVVWMAVGLLLLNASLAGAATVCEVQVTRLNLREQPSMSARISRVLDGRTQILVAGGCNAGWVRVVSDRGATRGYVGGWALQEVTQQHDAPQASSEEGAAVAAPGVGTETYRSRTKEAFSIHPAGVSPQESDSRGEGASGHSKSVYMVFNPEKDSWSHHTDGGSTISNEELAVQITENRIKVLALERRMQLVERALALVQDRLASGGQVQ
jgi:hypothetical protein